MLKLIGVNDEIIQHVKLYHVAKQLLKQIHDSLILLSFFQQDFLGLIKSELQGVQFA